MTFNLETKGPEGHFAPDSDGYGWDYGDYCITFNGERLSPADVVEMLEELQEIQWMRDEG